MVLSKDTLGGCSQLFHSIRSGTSPKRSAPLHQKGFEGVHGHFPMSCTNLHGSQFSAQQKTEKGSAKLSEALEYCSSMETNSRIGSVAESFGWGRMEHFAEASGHRYLGSAKRTLPRTPSPARPGRCPQPPRPPPPTPASLTLPAPSLHVLRPLKIKLDLSWTRVTHRSISGSLGFLTSKHSLTGVLHL